MRILNVSDHSVQVSFGEAISLECHREVAAVTRLLLDRAARASSGILNVHPAYASVLVSFDPRHTTHEAIRDAIQDCAHRRDVAAAPLDEPLIEVPVCYGGEFGPDLEFVAQWNKQTSEEVVRLHSSAEYRVFFLGFSPGFPYLGGLPEAIAAPRLDTPRKMVPAGSVAIGGSQTGIYPLDSASGWRVIGRTPLRLFAPEKTPPTLLQMGQRLKFVPVARDEYERRKSDSR